MTIPAEIARQRLGNSSPGLDHGPKARFLWDQAYVIDVGRGVEYLRGRGIGAGGPSSRFHPAVPLGRGRRLRFRPALLAAVVERDRLIAVQRIFLDTRLQALAPDLDEPRLLLGRPRKGAVRLEEPGAVLGLAEGVETALSASLLLRIPVWATLGSERLAAIDIPSCVRRLVLLPDADHAGVRAERRARSAYRALGLQTETRWPWFGLKDWNDVLRKEGRGM
ncbi:DUF7146 domain-containing protein [Sphingomonas sp. OTU376]|uniref:DUF7146 domain-containing protein n=1 Tax=Sphingomonas sp. OTU376 TaxID=3043863 RepID=UPI00313D193D